MKLPSYKADETEAQFFITFTHYIDNYVKISEYSVIVKTAKIGSTQTQAEHINDSEITQEHQPSSVALLPYFVEFKEGKHVT